MDDEAIFVLVEILQPKDENRAQLSAGDGDILNRTCVERYDSFMVQKLANDRARLDIN
jgi:hypothetical protein